MVCGHTIKMGMFAKNKLDPNIFEFLKFGRQTKIAARLIFKREYLVNILIMPERHFHFHFVVAARLYVNTNLSSHHCMVDVKG